MVGVAVDQPEPDKSAVLGIYELDFPLNSSRADL